MSSWESQGGTASRTKQLVALSGQGQGIETHVLKGQGIETHVLSVARNRGRAGSGPRDEPCEL